VIIGPDCLRIRVDRSTTCLPDGVLANDNRVIAKVTEEFVKTKKELGDL
jgi:hypothetical protein